MAQAARPLPAESPSDDSELVVVDVAVRGALTAEDMMELRRLTGARQVELVAVKDIPVPSLSWPERQTLARCQGGNTDDPTPTLSAGLVAFRQGQKNVAQVTLEEVLGRRACWPVAAPRPLTGEALLALSALQLQARAGEVGQATLEQALIQLEGEGIPPDLSESIGPLLEVLRTEMAVRPRATVDPGGDDASLGLLLDGKPLPSGEVFTTLAGTHHLQWRHRGQLRGALLALPYSSTTELITEEAARRASARPGREDAAREALGEGLQRFCRGRGRTRIWILAPEAAQRLWVWRMEGDGFTPASEMDPLPREVRTVRSSQKALPGRHQAFRERFILSARGGYLRFGLSGFGAVDVEAWGTFKRIPLQIGGGTTFAWRKDAEGEGRWISLTSLGMGGRFDSGVIAPAARAVVLLAVWNPEATQPSLGGGGQVVVDVRPRGNKSPALEAGVLVAAVEGRLVFLGSVGLGLSW